MEMLYESIPVLQVIVHPIETSLLIVDLDEPRGGGESDSGWGREEGREGGREGRGRGRGGEGEK